MIPQEQDRDEMFHLLQFKSELEKIKNERKNEFTKRAAHLLEHAEAFMENGDVESARELARQYHDEKVIAGLAGPVGWDGEFY